MQNYWTAAAVLILTILIAGCASPQAETPLTTPTPWITATTPMPQQTAHTVVQAGDTVAVHYTGTFDNGTVFDTTVNKTPFTFPLGKGVGIPGFEEAILGMRINESKTVFIPVDKAYGAYNRSLIFTGNRTAISGTDPAIGQYVAITRPSDGRMVLAKIINISETTFTYDANSPLAGENLTFSIRIAGIK